MSAYRRRFKHPETGKSAVDPQWRYRVWVTHADGRKERVTGTPSINTRKAAEQAEAAHVARALDPRKAASDLTFSKFWSERWLPAFGKRGAPSTVESRTDVYENHLQKEVGSTQLGAITKERIDRLVAALEGKGLAARTVQNVLTSCAGPCGTLTSGTCCRRCPASRS